MIINKLERFFADNQSTRYDPIQPKLLFNGHIWSSSKIKERVQIERKSNERRQYSWHERGYLRRKKETNYSQKRQL